MSRISIRLTEQELDAIIHALEEEYSRVQQAGGDCYGELSCKDVNVLIARLYFEKAMQGLPPELQ